MKQIRKKLKLIMHYIPSGYYAEKDKARFFINYNGKKKDIYLEKKANKTDFTFNELINEIRELFQGELDKCLLHH